MFIEASYLNQQPNKKLYGHLTPKWVLAELQELAKMVNPHSPASALKGLKIVVTHVKQGASQRDIPQKILQELEVKNNLGVEFILPKQGHLFKL